MPELKDLLTIPQKLSDEEYESFKQWVQRTWRTETPIPSNTKELRQSRIYQIYRAEREGQKPQAPSSTGALPFIDLESVPWSALQRQFTHQMPDPAFWDWLRESQKEGYQPHWTTKMFLPDEQKAQAIVDDLSKNYQIYQSYVSPPEPKETEAVSEGTILQRLISGFTTNLRQATGDETAQLSSDQLMDISKIVQYIQGQQNRANQAAEIQKNAGLISGEDYETYINQPLEGWIKRPEISSFFEQNPYPIPESLVGIESPEAVAEAGERRLQELETDVNRQVETEWQRRLNEVIPEELKRLPQLNQTIQTALDKELGERIRFQDGTKQDALELLTPDELNNIFEQAIYQYTQAGGFGRGIQLHEAAQLRGMSRAEYIQQVIADLPPEATSADISRALGEAAGGERSRFEAGITGAREAAVKESLRVEREGRPEEIIAAEETARQASVAEAQAGLGSFAGVGGGRQPKELVSESEALGILDRYLSENYPRGNIGLARRQFPMLYEAYKGSDEGFESFLTKERFAPFITYPITETRVALPRKQAPQLRRR